VCLPTCTKLLVYSEILPDDAVKAVFDSSRNETRNCCNFEFKLFYTVSLSVLFSHERQLTSKQRKSMKIFLVVP